MNWSKVRELAGKVWGATTTIVLALSVGVMGAMADPQVGPGLTAMAPWLPKVAIVLGGVAAVIRAVAKK